MVRSVLQTAGFNVVMTLCAGGGGIVLARIFGPTIRGEYAAITAWFGIALTVGSMGQPAALCFFVSSDPIRAREYVASSRAMMFATGVIALCTGILLAPELARGNATVETGYRIAFGASIIAYIGASYTFSLQARSLRSWNIVRVSQPVLSLVAVLIMWGFHVLTLDGSMLILAGTMLCQLGLAYAGCHRAGLVPGHLETKLIRPLSGYGLAQMAALTPSVINSQLDQLVLSQTVPSADLGRYAIAVSLSSLPLPLVAAIGYVGFPKLAAQKVATSGTRRIQRIAVFSSLGISAGILIPFSASAKWVIPMVFGPKYTGAVPLLWILTPGAICLGCNQVVGDLLRGRRKPVIVAWSQGLAAVFTVVMLLALIPFVGVYGAAIASTVAYAIALAVMLRSLWRLPDGSRAASTVSAHLENATSKALST